MVSEQAKIRFELAMRKHLTNDYMIPQIGSLAEKNIHAVLKHYLQPDEVYHEVRIGRYFADICKDGHIYEVQTRGFGKLRPKLTAFLKEHRVTVVYPIIAKRYINWVDHSTGEIVSSRISPSRPNIYNLFDELVYLKEILQTDRLTSLGFRVITLQANEYKLLDGFGKDKKKRSTKYTIQPTLLIDDQEINSISGLTQLTTNALDELCEKQGFTTKDLSRLAKVKIGTARCMANVLSADGINVIEQVGKKGNSTVYVTTR